MENLTCEEIAILGTIIAIDIVKNKSPKEIQAFKKLFAQILATLSNLNCS